MPKTKLVIADDEPDLMAELNPLREGRAERPGAAQESRGRRTPVTPSENLAPAVTAFCIPEQVVAPDGTRAVWISNG